MTEGQGQLLKGEVRLNHKPTAALHYSYLPGEVGAKTLVLFINGLLLPRSGWAPTITHLVRQYQESGQTRPALLAYDRFGQGTSDADPADEGKVDGQTHDMNDVVRDLDDFLVACRDQKPFIRYDRLVFVCNSIGCPIARLFDQAYPGTVCAFVFLDSMMADTDFVSIFPDPDAEGFEEDNLPQGVDVHSLRKAREIFREFFHPTLPNKEKLDRSNAAQLLPYSDQPSLSLRDDCGPLVTIVGHDWDVFAAENKRTFDLPEALIQEYMNPHWHRYNQGLARLTEESLSRGPIIATGCGHFIQRDDPDFVAREVSLILKRLESSQ